MNGERTTDHQLRELVDEEARSSVQRFLRQPGSEETPDLLCLLFTRHSPFHATIHPLTPTMTAKQPWRQTMSTVKPARSSVRISSVRRA